MERISQGTLDTILVHARDVFRAAILANAGIVGFLDNLSEFHAQADKEAGQWESFLSAWQEQLAGRIVTVGDLIKWMDTPDSVMREALPEDLATAWDAGRSFRTKLGSALTKRCCAASWSCSPSGTSAATGNSPLMRPCAKRWTTPLPC